MILRSDQVPNLSKHRCSGHETMRNFEYMSCFLQVECYVHCLRHYCIEEWEYVSTLAEAAAPVPNIEPCMSEVKSCRRNL